MLMFFVLMIALFIYLYISLSNENKELKEKIKELSLKNSDIIEEENKEKDSYNVDFDKFYEKTIINEVISNDQIDENEQTLTQEQRNNLILISGSILVILSAIIFLTSTWNITHDFLKTIVIMLMFGVFLSFSCVADRVFNLKQTSKTFYYLALAYIPIIFLAMGLFEIFGNYFSLLGDGKYLYLTISLFIIAGIYYYSSQQKKNLIMLMFSIIFQIFGLISMTLIFSSSLSIILTVLLVYNLILAMLFKYRKLVYNDTFHLKIVNVLSLSLSALFIFRLLNVVKIGIISLEDIVLEITLLVNLYYILEKLNKEEEVYNYIYPALITTICFSTACFIGYLYIYKQIAIVFALVVVYIYEYIKYNKIRLISFIEMLFVFSLMYMLTIIQFEGQEILCIRSYGILGIYLLLNTLNYIVTNKYQLYQAVIITITFVLTVFHIMDFLIVPQIPICISFIALGLITISIFIHKMDINFKNAFSIIGHFVIWILSYFCLIDGNQLAIIVLYSLYTLLCYYESILGKEDSLKIISYIYFNIVIGYLYHILNLSMIYVIPLTTIIILVVEFLVSKIKNNVINSYIIIQFILSLLLLLDYSVYNFILTIMLSIIFVIYINYYHREQNCMLIPALCLMIYIYKSNIFEWTYMYFISIAFILIIVGLHFIKQKNIAILLFYISMLCHILMLEEYKYVSIGLLLFGTFSIMMKQKNEKRDLFRFILYIFIYIFFCFVILDLNLISLTFLNVGSFIILTLLITRRILKKYDCSYKSWEYILCSFINLIALVKYSNEMDGIIYVLFLTLLVIVSYIYKLGPVFLVCLISIMFNVFLLTKTFWFNIPWWIYILLVGSILVTFAVYNEMKTTNKLKNKVIQIKTDLDF